MNNICSTKRRPICPRAHLGLALALPALGLIGCDSGSSDSPASQMNTTPPPDSGIPPLAASAVSLDGGPSVGSQHWAEGSTSMGGLGQPVDELECVYPSPITYHVHTHLSVFLNGEQLAIPAHVGLVEPGSSSECHYPLHTHDEAGLIHLHAEAPRTFTLGQFFDVWGQPLARDNLAGLMSLPTVVYITDDDVATEYTGELAAIELVSHRAITVQLGTEITEIPRYTWSGM